MLAIERQEQIVSQIRRNGAVRIHELTKDVYKRQGLHGAASGVKHPDPGRGDFQQALQAGLPAEKNFSDASGASGEERPDAAIYGVLSSYDGQACGILCRI